MVEAVTNVVVGFAFALVTQIAILPLFGLAAAITDNLLISGIYTAVDRQELCTEEIL
jgi:energy-converting hydrogenase Eha subunit H